MIFLSQKQLQQKKCCLGHDIKKRSDCNQEEQHLRITYVKGQIIPYVPISRIFLFFILNNNASLYIIYLGPKIK